MQPEERDSARDARRVRLLLVDDQPAIRRGLRMWLELQPDLEVVGEAESGEGAVVAAVGLRPDVVLMDAELPGMGGVAATAAVLAAAPGVAVVVQSLHDDAPTRARAREAGAAAFVGKGTGEEELLAAIRRLGSRQG
jgi:DNA-binding NarL/FixJ family response regulator